MVIRSPLQPGRHVLVWLAIALVPAVTVTAIATRGLREKHHELAAEWAGRGDAAMRESRSADAVVALRTSLNFDRENRATRLRLAQALIADGRLQEAGSYLMTLWADQPGNGPVNLELGRLAAREGNRRDAVRYYHNAVEGAWPADPEARRRTARIELTRFLLAQQAVDEAQAELLHLAGDMPDRPEAQKAIARLMLDARLPERALGIYQGILRATPDDASAYAGAGLAAFALGSDAMTERYLARAARAGHADPEATRALAVTRALTAIDPFRRRLGVRDRTARTARAVDATLVRLEACRSEPQAIAALQATLAGIRPTLLPRRVAREPEIVDAAMDVVFAAQRFARSCSEPAAVDRALLILADRREGTS